MKLGSPTNLLLVAIATGFGLYLWYAASRPPGAPGAPPQAPPSRTAEAKRASDPALLLRDATLAGDYLARAVGDDGRFVYEYDPETDETVDGYNMLRHAGSIYAMAELYGETRGPALGGAIERAIAYMKSRIEERDGAAVMLDDGDVKLGGNGLAILALTRWARVRGERADLALAGKLARWIVGVQNDDGSFSIHKQDWKTQVVSDFVSDYYPGEAAYALAMLGEETGDTTLVGAGRRAALATAARQLADGEIASAEHDHWLLYALGQLHAIAPDPILVETARPFVVAILDYQHVAGRPGRPADWAGGWYHPPRTTPSSVRCEGLAAAYPMFQAAGDRALAGRIRIGLEQGTAFILRHFVDEARAATLPDSAQAVGGVVASPTDANIRIDYVQHALSALLGYRRLLSS